MGGIIHNKSDIYNNNGGQITMNDLSIFDIMSNSRVYNSGTITINSLSKMNIYELGKFLGYAGSTLTIGNTGTINNNVDIPSLFTVSPASTFNHDFGGFISRSPVTVEPPAPATDSSILRYFAPQGNGFSMGNVTFTLDTNLPSNSYTSTITSFPGVEVHNPSQLIQVTIGNLVTTSISDLVFQSVPSLQSLVIGNSVTSIDGNAFANCYLLSSVTFTPTSKLLSIGNNAFYNCTALQSIAIPNSVTSIGGIGGSAFNGTSIHTVIISTATAIVLGKTSPALNVDFFGRTVETKTITP